MAELDDLFAQIPTADIASKLGADPGEVNNAIRTLVPVLVGGLHQKAEDPDTASEVAAAATDQAASGLIDGGVNVDDVDAKAGEQTIQKLFGGNETTHVAAALSNAGGGSNQLLQQLMPILIPIVLAYVGKKLAGGGGAAAPAQAPQASGGGGLGEILGSILGGKPAAQAGGDNPLGEILGKVIAGGGSGGGGLGNILGSILGGK